MSQSGTFTLQSNSYDGRYLKLTCTSSQDVTNNRTKVNWTLESIGGSSGHYSTIVTVNINGTQVYSIDQGYSYDAFPVTKGSTSGTVYVNMNTDGSHSPITIYMDAAIYVSSTTRYSDTYVLPTIPRYTTIKSFTVSKRNETSFTFNWQTANTVDYIQYSTNNGSSYTNLDVTDGTSGSFTVSGLSPSKTYNCKIKVRRKDSGLYTESAVVSQTTYAVPTQSLSSKTETSITMNWSCDTTASKIRYSTNNGSSWSSYITVNAKTGSYTITGLSAYTTYNIKTEVTRSATNTAYSTAASSQATYDYPYITKVGTTTLTIGNSQTLTLYNPLSRTVTIKMYKTNTSGTQLYSGTTNKTSITFTPTANTLYASIPSEQKASCIYSAIYSSSTKTITGSFYYQVDSSACKPAFTNFAYKDTASNDLITAINNDQVIVQNVSDINIVISSANKMVAKNRATESKYTATFSSLSKDIPYSSSDIDDSLGIPTTKGSQTLTVTAYDSRGLPTPASKPINIIEYASPVVTPSLTRLNNFEAETHFSVSGTFSKVTVNNTDKNLVKKVEYRYKESTSSTWESWTEITMSSQGNGSYQTEEVVLNFDNTKAYDFEFRTTDRAKATTVSKTLNVGQPLMFLDTNGNLEIYNDETVGNDLTVNNRTTSNQGFTVTHLNGGAGTSGYMYVCDLKITSQYQDQWIIFNTVQRNRFGKIYLRFLGGNTTDPTLRSFVKSGSGGFSAFIVKAATSTWSMYIQKSESYDDIEITGIEKGRYANGIQITWKNITATSVPTGYTEASMATIDVKASNATSADSATSATSATTATNATNTAITKTNPTSNTWYFPTFVTGDSGNLPQRVNNGLYYRTIEGTKSAVGQGIIRLGNTTASGTAGNKRGYLQVCGNTAHFAQLQTVDGISADRTIYMPNHNGTIQVRPTNLYNNTSGATGTVTLSASAANYTWLEIFYGDSKQGFYSSVRIYSPNGKDAALNINSGLDANIFRLDMAIRRISAKSITKYVTDKVVQGSSAAGHSIYNVTEMAIFRVDGWL